MFQYISCCYLSWDSFDFETGFIEFQYISCCYLSRHTCNSCNNWKYVSIHLMLLFIFDGKLIKSIETGFNTSHVVIYPATTRMSPFPVTRFNTSHVVIYRNKDVGSYYPHLSFNTSHVVIYLWCDKELVHGQGVSIHLMLLFIC